MKYLIKTTDNSALETVDYTRVIYDTTDDNVLIQNTIGGEVSSDFAKTADIVFYDKNAGKLIVVDKNTFDGSNYPIENYTPVGVVAIPSSHNVYGDGSCGVVSLMNMNTDQPDIGSVETNEITWGYNNLDIDTLPNLDEMPSVGYNSAGDKTSTVIGVSSTSYIPSDLFENSSSAIQCPHDLNAYYDYIISINNAAPSPYLTDGSRNPAYYQTTEPSSTSNRLADFNGKQNTQILCDLATAQADWKTASTITNKSGEGYYPAACCCWRFHTEGTNQGDWYLPAMGELGYVMARLKIINDTISLLSDTYGSSVFSTFNNIDYYFSSSEYARGFATTIELHSGGGTHPFKNDYRCCRSFCRINASGEIV